MSKPKQYYQREKHCFTFHPSKVLKVNNIIWTEQVRSTVEKQNHSPWQNAEVWRVIADVIYKGFC